MKYDINLIRRLLVEKEKRINSEEDKIKVDNLKGILQEDNIFFMIDAETAVGILDFLGVPKGSIKEVYMALVSPEAYKSTNDAYVTMGEK